MHCKNHCQLERIETATISARFRAKVLVMRDTKHRLVPLSHAELAPIEERFLTRPQLCERWGGCSEKALVRSEKRLGLSPYRILRGVRYALSDIMRIERDGRAKMPKKFTGLRPDQKAELLRREREELSEP
jgi:hypothetical protein